MDMDNYQAEVNQTRMVDRTPKERLHVAIAGMKRLTQMLETYQSVLEKEEELGHEIKKDPEYLHMVMGSILMTVSDIGSAFDIPLSEAAGMNLSKLHARIAEHEGDQNG